MGTIQVKANRLGAKKGEVLGFVDDRRIYQGEVFEISDAPLKFPSGDVIPGSIAAFSDNKRKALHPGWMEFVNPEDEKKYRSANPVTTRIAAAKHQGELSATDRAEFEAWKADRAKANAKATGDKPAGEKEGKQPAPKPGKEAKATGDKDVL